MDSDALRRAARTFFQGVIGVLVLLAIPVLNQLIQSVAGGGEVTIDLDLWRSIGIAAVAGGVIALIAFLQNALEDRTGSTGFLVRKS
jgi:predicted phage tail protein